MAIDARKIARYGVIENTTKGYLDVDETVLWLHLSERQVFRPKRKLKETGIEGIIHGNRGRVLPRRTSDPVIDTVDYLCGGKYTGFSIFRFVEML